MEHREDIGYVLEYWDTVPHKGLTLNSVSYKMYNTHKALLVGVMLYKLGPNIGYKVYNCTEEEFLSVENYKYIVKQWFDREAYRGDRH